MPRSSPSCCRPCSVGRGPRAPGVAERALPALVSTRSSTRGPRPLPREAASGRLLGFPCVDRSRPIRVGGDDILADILLGALKGGQSGLPRRLGVAAAERIEIADPRPRWRDRVGIGLTEPELGRGRPRILRRMRTRGEREGNGEERRHRGGHRRDPRWRNRPGCGAARHREGRQGRASGTSEPRAAHAMGACCARGPSRRHGSERLRLAAVPDPVGAVAVGRARSAAEGRVRSSIPGRGIRVPSTA